MRLRLPSLQPGCFPPPLFNRWAALRRLEARIERLRPLQGVLPYLLMSGREGPSEA